MSTILKNINISRTSPLITPCELAKQLPISTAGQQTVSQTRAAIRQILSGQDDRLLLLVGPCSIHDYDMALDYAKKLQTLKVADKFLIIMRVYFEKPRTVVGWKGFINDPDNDGTCDINKGIHLARRLLIALADAGIPAGTEFLDPIIPPYLSDLISWASIGARTTESQTHREMASGLSMPVGFKNGTDGNLDVAIAALQAASHPHSFLGLDNTGTVCIYRTTGNPWGHIILRGGRLAPNYKPADIQTALQALDKAGVYNRLMVDCSHANSMKKAQNQGQVFRTVMQQQNPGILGAMLESHLHPGNQPSTLPPKDRAYGVSITDACIGWDETEALIQAAYTQR